MGAGSAVLHARLHLVRSRASSGAMLACRISSFKRSSHLFLGLSRGRWLCWFSRSAVHATDPSSLLTTWPYHRSRPSRIFSMIGAMPICFLTSSFVTWSHRVTIAAFAFPLREGPARAWMLPANTPIYKGQWDVPRSCKFWLSFEWALVDRIGCRSMNAHSNERQNLQDRGKKLEWYNELSRCGDGNWDS